LYLNRYNGFAKSYAIVFSLRAAIRRRAYVYAFCSRSAIIPWDFNAKVVGIFVMIGITYDINKAAHRVDVCSSILP